MLESPARTKTAPPRARGCCPNWPPDSARAHVGGFRARGPILWAFLAASDCPQAGDDERGAVQVANPQELIWTRVIPDILGRRALPARRLARLGATPDFHHGLLVRVAHELSSRGIA